MAVVDAIGAVVVADGVELACCGVVVAGIIGAAVVLVAEVAVGIAGDVGVVVAVGVAEVAANGELNKLGLKNTYAPAAMNNPTNNTPTPIRTQAPADNPSRDSDC